jgi:phospholipid transport system substrate-binding protein
MFDFKKNILLLLSLMAMSSHLHANQSADPYVFVEQVATALFHRINTDQGQIQENPDQLKIIVEQELLPHIDHGYSALLVLGNNTKTQPKDKVVEFIEAFKVHLITTYALSLGYYQNQLVVFEPAKPYVGKKIVSIKAIIKETDRGDIDVVFKVRKNKAGQWKVFDMVAEGISLIRSKRAEFTPVIKRQGIDAVIQVMKVKGARSLKEKV